MADWDWSDVVFVTTLPDDPKAIWIDNEGKAVPTSLEGKALET